MNRLTKKQATEALDAIQPGTKNVDPEIAHWEADKILLAVVTPEIREAYERVIERAGAWWYA